MLKPLNLVVWRKWLFSDESIGKLYANKKFIDIYTLEDEVRPAGEKVYGETAIPYGKYPVQITFSPKFKRDMPLIENVPGFDGIRIHTGNTNHDTAGCLLVGTKVEGRTIQGSKEAFEKLYAMIDEAQKEGREITIEFANTERFYAMRIVAALAIFFLILIIYKFIIVPTLNNK